jgi:hypothetical protein
MTCERRHVYGTSDSGPRGGVRQRCVTMRHGGSCAPRGRSWAPLPSHHSCRARTATRGVSTTQTSWSTRFSVPPSSDNAGRHLGDRALARPRKHRNDPDLHARRPCPQGRSIARVTPPNSTPGRYRPPTPSSPSPSPTASDYADPKILRTGSHTDPAAIQHPRRLTRRSAYCS